MSKANSNEAVRNSRLLYSSFKENGLLHLKRSASIRGIFFIVISCYLV